MSYLFIDSTYDLVVGALDERFRWLSLEISSGIKASTVIQKKSFQILEQAKLRPKELAGIVTVNGPGFYTGLRLAEGFSDVFSFFGVNKYSFYSFEVPLWCGITQGTWFTKAYRGEYYFYRWQESDHHSRLVSAKELAANVDNSKFYAHSDSALDQVCRELVVNPVYTSDLIQAKPELIFPQVLKAGQREAFYFRAPEDEFKANP